MKTNSASASAPVSVTNACKLCSPLGAVLAFKGIEGAVSLLHGSQGCATYIRRYMISHYREPLDVASSSFSEESAVFGGSASLMQGLDNLKRQYNPSVIGIATTCLSETIGDDVNRILASYKDQRKNETLPHLINVSTAAYRGTHAEGFNDTVAATVKALAKKTGEKETINIFPGMVSPEDLRNLKELLSDIGTEYTLFPDYSETLDGAQWDEYKLLPPGGTKISAIQDTANAGATIEFGNDETYSAGKYLESEFGVNRMCMNMPVGIKATDYFMQALEYLTGTDLPQKYEAQRGRLIDSYVDSHKYLTGLKAAVYGDEVMVTALAVFLDETGILPAVCASGANAGNLERMLRRAIPDFDKKGILVLEETDFENIEKAVEAVKPAFMLGSSKGYKIARKFNIPLVRCGFPVHDRSGAARIAHLFYEGTQQLFDRIVNSVLEARQEVSGTGYSYL